MFKKKTVTDGASVERLKNRSLMCSEKQVTASVQTPPPASPELTKAISERQARDAEWYRRVEEKTRSLVAQERSLRNLRAVYEAGTTFEIACQVSKLRSARKREQIEAQNPGMFLNGLYDGPEIPNARGCEIRWWEHGYAREFLKRELADVEVKCEHGKSWCEECELCDANVDLKDAASWDQRQANTILAKLGLSVWQGKSKFEGYCGEGRAVEGIEARSHNPRPWREGNAPDSFEKTCEQAPEGQGQINSQPDPNYAGITFGLGKTANAPLEGSDNPNFQQVDVKQNLATPDQLFSRLRATENKAEVIFNEAHERIKESSTEAEVERIMEKANRKVEALDRPVKTKAGKKAEEDEQETVPPEERLEEPEQDVLDEDGSFVPSEE